MDVVALKPVGLLLLASVLIVAHWTSVSAADGSGSIELRAVEDHHIIELGSNQPYVAGYHVNTRDLSTRENVDATAITVSFPSTNASEFPYGSWLGGGMFVQAQDSRYRHVDYGFYMMLVVDWSGSAFIDLGLHQTREGTLPVQMPTEEVKYAFTWEASGLDLETPVTLLAGWDSDGWVHYSFCASERNISLTSVNVAGLPDCEHIIPKFYAGNVIVEPFPFSRYVNYFQFGVVSSEPILSDHWSVDLKEPRMLRPSGWVLVEDAWSIQGNIAHLDWDWPWGGASYTGVSAQYYKHPLNNPYEIVFAYSGQTLEAGTILWENTAYLEMADTESRYPTDLFAAGYAPLLIALLLSFVCVPVARTLHRLANPFRETIATRKLEETWFSVDNHFKQDAQLILFMP